MPLGPPSEKILPKTAAVLLLTSSILNLPGLLGLSDLLVRILTFAFYLNTFFKLWLLCRTLQHKKCWLGCSSLCFQPSSGNTSLTSSLSFNKRKWLYDTSSVEVISLLDYWKWGGCHLTPFLVEMFDRHRSLSVTAMAGHRLERTSLCPSSLPNITRPDFG